ncbi:MAG: amidohydrolase family protein [Anaerotruncus sp.]|jgi:5-methylthioadenosine/S-adenosylhomocysteine deaminase|nr:amidohydrolase family protein [Anaerotruncus sp.]
MRRLIKNGRVHQAKGNRSIYKAADILLDGERILEIAPHIPSEAAQEVIDAARCIILPGLINSHIHTFDAFYRGSFDNLPLELWIMKLRPFLSGLKSTPEYIRLRTLYNAIQLLKTGSTTVLDDLVQVPWNDADNLAAVFEGYEQAGLRAYVATTISDLPMHHAIPFLRPVLSNELKQQLEAAGKTPHEVYLSYLREQIARYNRPGRIQKYMLSVSGPQRSSIELQRKIRNLAEEHDLPVVNHVMETRLQRSGAEYAFGKSLIQYMEDNHLLYEQMSVIHAVWIDQHDIDLMAKRGCSVVHCPGSNFKLGSGISPVEGLLRAGIPVGIGSDNPSCSDNMNLFEQIRLASVIHKVRHSNFHNWVGAEDALRMATAGGSHCARMAHELGSIEVGKQADLIILDANSTTYIPENNYTNQIAFCENGSSVRDVLIAGVPVVRNREITTFDEQKVLDEVMELTDQIHHELKKADEESRLIMDAFERAYFTAHGMLSYRI